MVSATKGAARSDFPEAEVNQRIAKVRQAIGAAGLDALLVYDEGGWIGGGNVRYLAGYSDVAPPMPAFMVVGRQGNAKLCISEGMGGTDLNLHDMFGLTKDVHDFGDNPLAPNVPGALVAALSEVGFTKGKLGVDALGALRHPIVEALRRNLPGAELVNAARLVEWVRREKSEAELENYRHAGRLTKRAMEMFIEVVRPGTPQSLAVSEVVHATEAQGAEALGLIHGCGDPWHWGFAHRGALTFREDDFVACELNARYHGYYAQVCRTWSLGKIRPEQDKLLSAVKAAGERMLKVIKPGMTGREVYLEALDEVKKRGYDFCNVRFGHGLGLTIGEGFDFADWDNSPNGPCLSPIPEGAFGVFHPFLIEKDSTGRGVFNALWGDPWVLRAHGPEMIV